MSSVKSPVIKSLLRGHSLFLRTQQRRWAQVHDVRFLATHHDPSHVLEKYRSKLAQKAKQEGHGSIESLKEAYKDKINDLRQKASTAATPEPSSPSPTTAKATIHHPPPPPPRPQSAPAKSGDGTGIKPLSSYLDVEKVLTLPPKEIEALWRLRHANNPNSICACIPLETYKRIVSAARQHPQFILPLPRQTEVPSTENSESEDASKKTTTATGADIHFLQWAFHPPASRPNSAPPSAQTANTHTSTIIFTHLGAYKLHGSFAEPHTTITHHLDLADEKGLVLMHGQVMPDRGVSTSEASWLVSCVQRFYDFGGQANGRKSELLQSFTKGDTENFKVEDLVEESEKL
ncbi:hypothetical protein MPDQ_006053 [Monascus purpureus]|uniref:ATP synthase mitochondrial F1 complex assembly factor 1 n=1 Tax=Monascus purpureus TaxID=5098 RepID=A0A507QV08_MONPU|nr:hypothetical protein MPDQ_006053 [Monascus purpureus]BDD55475.1 hypothetical protein MAP00_000993 [Monascus purpureus]